jgi:hypothetical protein
MPKDTYVKDVGIGKMFSVQGAKFSYSGKLITETQEGYNLKVHSSFRFRVKQDGERGFDLSVDQLRQALAGEPIATFKQQQQQKNQQITFD